MTSGKSAPPALDETLVDLLACPIDRGPLQQIANDLWCAQQHGFPIVAGIPVLLTPDQVPTLPDVFENTLRILEQSRLNQTASVVPDTAADAFVEDWIVRTCGNLYRHLRRPLPRFPIPRFPVEPRRHGELLLDVGANWGRWTLAGAQQGFCGVALDPNLEAAVVGRTIASLLGLNVRYIVGDARSLPFPDETFDMILSYSTLQHFPKDTARVSMREIRRVMTPRGRALIQLPNLFGVRQCTNRLRQLAQRNRRPFRVRYWTPNEIAATGKAEIGPSTIAVDGYFSLNPRPEDLDLLSLRGRALVIASTSLARLAKHRPFRSLRQLADSLWLYADRDADCITAVDRQSLTGHD